MLCSRGVLPLETTSCLHTCVWLYGLITMLFDVSVNWSVKAKRRRTTGTGRMRHLRLVHRRYRNGFREGTQAKIRTPRQAKSEQV